MSPVIPHRTLVGVEDSPFDDVRPGEIIACRGKGLPALLRAIGRGGDGRHLLCLAEGSGRHYLVGREGYGGAVRWCCHRGEKKALETPERRLPTRVYLALARKEAGWPFLAPLRRWVSPFLGEPLGHNPEETEIPHLLRELRFVMGGSGNGPPVPPKELDWGTYLELALCHAVHGMLGREWRGLPPESGPHGAVMDLLAKERGRSEKAWADSRGILGLVLPAFEAAGTPCIVLKGPSMGPAYGERHLERWFGDLDLLVKPDHVERSVKVLESLGFRSKAKGAAQTLLRKGHFHMVLRPPASYSLSVELHWHLVDRGNFFTIDLDGIYSRSRIIDLGGLPVPALGPEDEMCYLCLHLRKHGLLNGIALKTEAGAQWLAHGASGNRLIWFVDLVRCLERRDATHLDPFLLWERARLWNAEEEVLESLLLLRDLFSPGAVGDLLEAAPEEPLQAVKRASGRASFWAGGRRRRRLLRWGMTMHPVFSVRPVRMLELWGLFFPSREKLSRLYGGMRVPSLVLRRFTHPFSMARKLWGDGGPFKRSI